jgi:tRNA 2-thiouridine synthesizing protein A
MEVKNTVERNIPEVGKVDVSRVVDCRGMVCPRPQLMTQKALNEMLDGEVCEVLIDNPPSLETIPAVIAKNNSTLLGKIQDGNMWRIYFKKGRKA